MAQKKITGLVTGVSGLPLPGVTVVIKGNNSGTMTDDIGQFSITAKTGDIIILSYIGYKSRYIRIGNENYLKLSLSEAITNLDEIIITGYSSQKIKEITGSVASVKPNELTAIPAGQVEQMLQGRVAGLNIITSGEPGSATNIRLHGIGNFGNVTPLYIIDGVEGNINSLNPYDIESINVLKDAGAYSIYGVRGANGVIVVTTKKGKPGKTKINYDFYISTTRPLKKGLNLLNPQEQADLLWLALRNSKQVDPNTGNPSDPLYGNGRTPVLPDYLFAGIYRGLFEGDILVDPAKYNIDNSAGSIYQIVRFNKTGTDWLHEMFKPALSQNHFITASGGNEKNKYSFSLGYMDQQGTFLNSYLKRFTTRINTEFNVSNSIRFGENLQLTYSNFGKPSQSAKYGLDISNALLTDPYLPVYDIKGNWSSYGGVLAGPETNPVAIRMLSKDDKNWNLQNFGNVFGEIDFLKNFNFRTSVGGTFNTYYSYNYSYGSYQVPSTGPNNILNEKSGYSRSWLLTNALSYSNTFGKYHNIKVLAATEQIGNYNREVGGSRMGFFTDDPYYRFLSNGSGNLSNYSFAGTSTLNSFISRFDYGFKDKFFLSGTLRRDGSSIFSPNKRFGWFPSVAVAWRMTEENFMKGVGWINELKLRASWGKTGFAGNTDPNNQYTLYGGGPGDAYYDIYGNSTGSIQQGFRALRFGNANTSWQEDIVTNFGFEGVLWDGKLNITFDWYNKRASGLLFPLPLPGILGDVIPPNVNLGSVKNTGLDLLLSSKGNFSKSWKWDVIVTLSHYNNKIIKLTAIPYFDDFYTTYGAFIRNEVGYPVSSFFGYKIIGLFQDSSDVAKSPLQDGAAPGRFKYADVNGRDSTGKLTGKPDGKITDDDRVHYGNPNPKFTLGFNLGINYKNFDFSTFFYGSFGNDVLNDLRYTMDIFPSQVALTPKNKTALYDSWTPQNKNAKAPIIENDQNFSNAQVINSYRLEKGTYLRNKSIILGYTFPGNLFQKIKIERLRIYAEVVNLFTITNYTGLDPELSGTSSAYGIDIGNYPNNQKQYLIGLNLNF